MKQVLKNFYNDIGRKKRFWMPVFFLTWASFGFSIMNRTVSIDDLATELYVDGNIWLSEYRWGGVIWKKMATYSICTPYLDKFLSIHFMMLAAALACCVLYHLTGDRKNIWTYTVTAGLLITYPLINEIWEYTCGATIIVPGCFMLVALVLLSQVCRSRFTWQSLAWHSLVLAFVAASGESLMFVYVTAVLCILFYKYCVQEKGLYKAYGWFPEGLVFALPLILGVVIKFAVGKAIMLLLHLERSFRGETQIAWPLTRKELVTLVRKSARWYGVNGLVYFPITIFDICVILFIIMVIVLCVRRKSLLPLLLGFFIGLSLFFQTLIQGTPMPYRTALTLTVFTGFTLYLLLAKFQSAPRGVYRGAVLILLFLCWRQSAYLNMILALDNLRSENEAAQIRMLGQTLVSQYYGRKVTFVGPTHYSRWTDRQITVDPDSWNGRLYFKAREIIDPGYTADRVKYVDTNLSSAIEFYRRQFEGQLMDEYLSYYGYDIDVFEDVESETYGKYWNGCQARGMHAYEIWDVGDMVVVCVGDFDN
ncbi:MAG: glucosyltransferase domain-containing protein [Lachnospiraceae bacterium]|jgi:hypothetical protein|nr:glucosyltransferase domain-containing protein [Lachnospiraceae bacterium]